LVFSNTGYHVAIGTLDGLEVAGSYGSGVKILDVPYFPVGMGEWWLYPRVIWEQDDKSLLLATGTSIKADWDNFDVSSNFVYRIKLENDETQELWTFTGSP